MFSIYVPRVLNEHSVQSVSNIMSHFNIGIVQHVDFTPINKKPGFYESFDLKYKSAFIHFVDVPGYQMNNDFWIALKDQSQGYKLQISHFEYWICLKNHSPIQRTMMNIHQVVENGRYLEDRIAVLEDKLTQLQAKFDKFITPMIEPPKLQRQDNNPDGYTQEDDWKVLDKSQFTKQNMSTRDYLRYCKYELDWGYDDALDR